jgi:hypothetical protein
MEQLQVIGLPGLAVAAALNRLGERAQLPSYT